MEITGLRLNNFRNIKEQKIQFGSRINVFVGDNGQGKTNILEAVYLCSRGRSFRTSKTEHLINKESQDAFLDLHLRNGSLNTNIDLKLNKTSKKFRFNEKAVSSIALSEKFPTVLFSPESLQAIKEGPEQRRALLDDLLVTVSPENQQVLANFERAMKSKNRLLKDYASQLISKNQVMDVLQSLLPNYLERAVDLTMARLGALKFIQNDLLNTFRAIVNDKSVDISVEYVISGQDVSGWTRQNVIDAMSKRQQELLPRELESGVSLVGPQKHEIRFLYNRNDSRFFCSQGQQRAIVLSFKISQVLYHFLMHKTMPVLLLDDVLSELDFERRNFLIRFLRESEAQTVVTTTDLAFCEDLHSKNLTEFRVSGGKVEQK